MREGYDEKAIIQGEYSYAAQEPWLFTGTVRSNILFGQNYDRKRYNELTKCCALPTGFQKLHNGDKTIVAERGASLSGGQRARISLARTVFSLRLAKAGTQINVDDIPPEVCVKLVGPAVDGDGTTVTATVLTVRLKYQLVLHLHHHHPHLIKHYEDAIKQHKAGRPVEYDELPVPPDLGPLPLENTAAKSVHTPSSRPARPAAPPVSPETSSSSDGTADTTATTTPSAPKRASPQKKDLTTRTSGNHQKNNLAEQQMKLLLEKQKEFKLAAIEAKKAGEVDQAKEFLKIYKGFESLLNAASSGLPVGVTLIICKAL